MFDYICAEQYMPSVQCPECNYKMYFHGGYYPIEIVCQNCGASIHLGHALSKLTYPNCKYDENGRIIKECND